MHASSALPPAKIIITGTGRAGTTYLVQLLTTLGLDTGYRAGDWGRDYYEHCSAGLERRLEDPDAPLIVKDPKLCDTLSEILAGGRVRIAHALVPIRALDDATASRIRVGGNGKTPGGLTGTSEPAAQRAVLAERFHHLVQTLVAHEIPHTFLDFPRFVTDPAYAYRQLRPILGAIPWEQFQAAAKTVARPELIHRFDGLSRPPDTGAPARAFARRRWTRRLRRAATVVSVLVALALVRIGYAGRTEAVAPDPAHPAALNVVERAQRSFARTQLAPVATSVSLQRPTQALPPPAPLPGNPLRFRGLAPLLPARPGAVREPPPAQ